MQAPSNSRFKDRPFPRRCYRCRQQQVVRTVMPYSLEFKHDEILHTINIPRLETPKCGACGEIVFDAYVDEQICAAVRSHLHLLEPAAIREGRDRLGLTLGELAGRLGVSEELLSKWENDLAIQSRAADNLLRLFFAFPNVREVLIGKQQDPQLGVLVG